MEENRDYAPVIIPTLCRYEHFKRCIESLQENPYAKYTDIYIGLDYPAKENHKDGYNKIKKYLESKIQGFSHVYIFEQKENIGLSRNWRLLRDKAYEKHDTFIYVEDDNEFSPNYLEYMNQCLWKYENNDEIIAVTGFNYPTGFYTDDYNIIKCDTYFSAFGYGTWRKKRDKYMKYINMEYFEHLYKSTSYMACLRRRSRNQFCNFVKGMVMYTDDLIINNQIRKCDLAYGIYMLSDDKYMVFPVKSKVRNWGYDGSGLNCIKVMNNKIEDNGKITHREFNVQCQEIDENIEFGNVIEPVTSDAKMNDKRLDNFFRIKFGEMMKTDITYFISRVIGINSMRNLIRLIKK